MNDSNKRYVEYMQELQKLYSEIYSTDDIPPTDHEIADDILGLLDKKDVPLKKIESWMMSHGDRLSTMIGENKSVLTKQPYFILMDYYFKNHRTFLKNNWPLNNESLKLLFHIEGVSYRDD